MLQMISISYYRLGQTLSLNLLVPFCTKKHLTLPLRGDATILLVKATPLRWEQRASTDLLPHYAVLPKEKQGGM